MRCGRGRGHGHGASPRVEDSRDKYIAWIFGLIRGQTHRQDDQVVHPRRRRVVQVRRFRRLAAMCAHPPASSFGTFTRACAATTRRHAPSWATHFARASIGPPRLLMPARSCAPAKGANFTPAKLTSRSRPPDDSHHMAFCCVVAGHCRALVKGARGLHPPTGRHRQVLQVGRGAPDHEKQPRIFYTNQERFTRSSMPP
jgi:hypothetical protein